MRSTCILLFTGWMVGWPLIKHQCIWMVSNRETYLCVCIEPLFGASGVNVMKLLFLLRLDVFILLHPASIFHIGPVGRQNHKVVDLMEITSFILAVCSLWVYCCYNEISNQTMYLCKKAHILKINNICVLRTLWLQCISSLS